MDGIKRALRLAGDERGADSEDLVLLDAPAKTIQGRRLNEVDPGAIVYTQSTVITVDAAHLERSRVMSGMPDGKATRAYKLLRTHVLERMERERWQSIAVVSPSAREGKTLTAINLSLALASSVQYTVMLVDCDWRKPSVHEYFDYVPERDITSHLDDAVPLSSVIVNPSIPRFCFVPCREVVPNSAEKLRGSAMHALTQELRDRYSNRFVLYDLPPLLITDDALSFLPSVDCVLLVVEENKTKRADLERAIEVIGQDRLLGTVGKPFCARASGLLVPCTRGSLV